MHTHTLAVNSLACPVFWLLACVSFLPEKRSIHVAGVAVALDSSHPSNQNLMNLLCADGRNRFQPSCGAQLHFKVYDNKASSASSALSPSPSTWPLLAGYKCSTALCWSHTWNATHEAFHSAWVETISSGFYVPAQHKLTCWGTSNWLVHPSSANNDKWEMHRN